MLGLRTILAMKRCETTDERQNTVISFPGFSSVQFSCRLYLDSGGRKGTTLYPYPSIRYFAGGSANRRRLVLVDLLTSVTIRGWGDASDLLVGRIHG